jgi:hypothetical protein
VKPRDQQRQHRGLGFGPTCAGLYRSAASSISQKSRIGSIRSAKINTTPEIKITPPTTYATGNSFAVST